MFTLANSIAVSMYLIGFCESLLDMLEQYVEGFTSILHAGRINDIRMVSCVTLVLILCLAIVGMDWVTRVQMGLLVRTAFIVIFKIFKLKSTEISNLNLRINLVTF